MQVFAKKLPLMACWHWLFTVAGLSVCACATSGARHPARVEVEEQGSFTIIEELVEEHQASGLQETI